MSIVDEVPKGELDYSKVPSHGQDADISESLNNLSETEQETGHSWNPRGFNDLPSSQIEFELVQQGAKLRREGYKPPTLEDLKPKVPYVEIPDDDVEDAA